MKRREFMTLLSGAAAWPLTAHAQQGARMRRIGILINLASDDAEGQARLAAFHQGLKQLGWTVGRNVQIDYRWGAGDADRIPRGVRGFPFAAGLPRGCLWRVMVITECSIAGPLGTSPGGNEGVALI